MERLRPVQSAVMDEVHGDRVGSAGTDKPYIHDDAANLLRGIWKDVALPLEKTSAPLEKTLAPQEKALGKTTDASNSSSLPAFELNNHWQFQKEIKPGVDQISNTVEMNLPAADFLAQNPDVKLTESIASLQSSAGKDGFKLRHATTGEVDAGWKFEGLNADGTVRMTKEYSMNVNQKERHNGLVETIPGVPAVHTKAIEKKLAELPPNVLKALGDKGYKIIATGTNTDAIPELAGKTPRGWPKDMDFDNSDGTHDNVRRVILAPFRFNREDGPAPVDRPEVVVHQIGHALDHAYGKLSNDPEFQKAFKEDMKKLGEKFSMSDRERMIYDYFNQKEGPGKGERPGSEEAFASLFGMILTGPENPGDRVPFEKNFPATIKIVRAQIKKL